MAFLVAHGGGNDLARLRECERLGIRLIECDLRLWRGGVDVRHLKTVGPLPIYWDRWRLASPFARHPRLAELLDAVGPKTELMLDLKGRNERLAELVVAALPEGRPVTVCARNWRLLEHFTGRADIRIVHSVGTPRELRALLALRDVRLQGVSIHERLLDPATAAALRKRAALVLTWPVQSARRASELARLGADGLITTNLTLPAGEPS